MAARRMRLVGAIDTEEESSVQLARCMEDGDDWSPWHHYTPDGVKVGTLLFSFLSADCVVCCVDTSVI